MIAYCGPGRTVRTALILLLAGEDTSSITAIYESRHLPDPDAIYLADPPAFPLPPLDPGGAP